MSNGKCKDRKSLVREAKGLARANPKTGERRSLRKITAKLAKIGGVVADTGTPGPKRPRAYYYQNPQFGFYFLQLISHRLFKDIQRLATT